jgi:hypothetical protein
MLKVHTHQRFEPRPILPNNFCKIVRQICAKGHKENPVFIENTGFFDNLIISWRTGERGGRP